MDYVRLGRGGMLVSRTAIGAEAWALCGMKDEVSKIVHTAYESGINLFDVSRAAPQSEEALGSVLKAERDTQLSLRRNIMVATKTSGQTYEEVFHDVEESLKTLGVERIDLLQYQANGFLPMQDGEDGVYRALDDVRTHGKARCIGAVTDDYTTAEKAVQSGIYDVLQYPYSMVSSMTRAAVRALCEKEDVGFLAMRPLCGGVVQNLPLAYGFLRQYDNVVPLWGVRSEAELKSLMYFCDHPPVIDEVFRADVEKVRTFFS